jgi:2-methylcitrate dehydratase PrpD
MDATEAIATWVAETPRHWTPECREQVRRAFLDTVACIVSGSPDAAARGARATFHAWATGGSTVVGTDMKLPSPWAALANGTAAHALDYDDVLVPALSHPSAALVPAILALGEEIGASGADCIDAYVVGFEVMARLGEAMNVVHYQRGWHTTLSLGAPGVAAACARLLRLDRSRTRHAIALSTSMAGGSKRQFGTMAKPLHAGLAAQSGIVAARLAESGVTGAPDVFQGSWGMVEMQAGPDAPGFDAVLPKLGKVPAMTEHGVWFKFYPCCASTHRPVDALLGLCAQYDIWPEQVARIEARISEVAFANLKFLDPQDELEARFSLPYCLARALMDRKLVRNTFTMPEIRRPDIRILLPRVTQAIDPELRAQRQDKDIREGATVEVHLADGRGIRASVDVPHGYPTDPLTNDELVEKFRDCGGGVLDTDATNRALAALARLETLPRIDQIMAALHVDAGVSKRA